MLNHVHVFCLVCALSAVHFVRFLRCVDLTWHLHAPLVISCLVVRLSLENKLGSDSIRLGCISLSLSIFVAFTNWRNIAARSLY